jgi:hypothetical protein
MEVNPLGTHPDIDTYFKENVKRIINISLYDYKTKGWSGIGEDHDSCTT